MAASSLDQEGACWANKKLESPRQERPWQEIPLHNEEQIFEALQLWGMPAEAWPKRLRCNYALKKKDHPGIHVYLRRQVFATTPAHEKHTYFSFWMSNAFEVGPVANPYGIGASVNQSKGYDHCSAALAFGEIKLLAGWADEPFLLEWHNQFNLHKLPGRTVSTNAP